VPWRSAPAAAGILLAVLSGSAAAARAGTVLVARTSTIEAAGGSGPGAYEVSNGTRDFGRFADGVSYADGAVTPAEAHQYSVPGLTETGLEGAFAEGSVRAGIQTIDEVGPVPGMAPPPGGVAHAESNFGLTFRVTDADAHYTLGAAMGTSGDGSATIRLARIAVGGTSAAPGRELADVDLFPTGAATEPVLEAEIGDTGQEDSDTLDHEGVLKPGTYVLTVHARSTGSGEEGSWAYYNMSLGLTGPPASIPLPPAAWSGLGTLAGMIALRWMHTRHRRSARQQICPPHTLVVCTKAG
jgi:hypothetical protein